MAMDFEAYRAKLLVFHEVFALLTIVPVVRTFYTEETKNCFANDLRDIMTFPYKDTDIPEVYIPVEATMLTTLKNVNLAADAETLARQAELVKNEILEHGKHFRIKTLEKKPKEQLPIAYTVDYIRDQSGRIVYPFEYWEDCVEVYLRKYLFDQSNARIASTYKFKSTGTAQGRQRQLVVANILKETERLRDAALSRKFPPKIMSGARQPAMIN